MFDFDAQICFCSRKYYKKYIFYHLHLFNFDAQISFFSRKILYNDIISNLNLCSVLMPKLLFFPEKYYDTIKNNMITFII